MMFKDFRQSWKQGAYFYYIIWMFYNVSMAFVRTTLVKLKSSQSNSVVA
ncbi:hypothetical protein STACA0001_0186 [Staphylococcus capitis SK14]|nr:hypothetical protein STACA0001_0186 [Staphylococcus capitis SK14]